MARRTTYDTPNQGPERDTFKNKTNSVARVRERTIPNERRLSAKIVPNFADKGCRDKFGRLKCRCLVINNLLGYATSRKGAGLIPDEVIYFLILPNPFSRTRPWGLLSL
jgi:hypothetical protein